MTFPRGPNDREVERPGTLSNGPLAGRSGIPAQADPSRRGDGATLDRPIRTGRRRAARITPATRSVVSLEPIPPRPTVTTRRARISAALDVQDVGQVAGQGRCIDLGRRRPTEGPRDGPGEESARPPRRPKSPRAKGDPRNGPKPEADVGHRPRRGDTPTSMRHAGPPPPRTSPGPWIPRVATVTPEARRLGDNKRSKAAPRAIPRRLSRSRSMRRPRTSRTLTVPTGQFNRRAAS